MSAISLIDFQNQTQDKMRRGLVQKITNESIFLKLLRFISVDGFTYQYGEQTALGSIAFRGINQQYTADVGVVNPKYETLSVFGGEIDTDRQLAGLRGGAARVNAILAKTRKAGLFYDAMCINGDPATTEKSFYGLKARLTGNQLLNCGTNGGALTLAKVDALIDAVVGPNNKKVLIMNKQDRRALKALSLAAVGGAVLNDVGGSLPAYDNVKIEVLDEDGDEQPILAKTETWGSSSVTSSMYCIRPGEDPEGEFVQGLIGSKTIEHEGQGPRGTTVVDIVEMLGGLAVFHGRAAARLAAIL